jgi:hypothetical protein
MAVRRRGIFFFIDPVLDEAEERPGHPHLPDATSVAHFSQRAERSAIWCVCLQAKASGFLKSSKRYG